ncbi:MAG: AAA family ATPase [Fimbriimonadaceae bacterium]|nr:AAA family ATPase [Fimbriimonadaceae bacterium]
MTPEGRPRTLEILDRIAQNAPANDARLKNYIEALREELEQEGKSREEQNAMLAQYQEAYEKLTRPANRLGVLLKLLPDGQAMVALGDSDYVVLIDPSLDPETLEIGSRVRLNEGYAIVGIAEGSEHGGLIRVAEALADGRLRVGGDTPGAGSRLAGRHPGLAETEIKAGDEVRLDPSGRFAVEHFPKKEAQDWFVEEISETPWSAIGGQTEAIRQIRESIEQPMLYPEIYAKFNRKAVKGILLYGPPGCGKTMIGRAIAWNLAREYSERVGHEVKECFLHINGPKILNMWLGETERMVRDIFATAREKAKEDRLVVIFIDEAESVLRTRSSGRTLNISNTVVPQFNAEMDGLIALQNVVVVLTSNRPDYIDPAILRPERIDRKIKINRPGREDSKQILGLYLSEDLPLDPAEIAEHGGPECARLALLEQTLAHLWRESRESEFLQVSYRSGETETLHRHDLVSGALLKSVVDRAKESAIRRAISEPAADHGIRSADLKDAVDAEFGENEIFPKDDVLDDWLKLIDVEPEMVAAVKPIRPGQGSDFLAKSVF